MRTRYANVEGHPGLIRDLKTNAVISSDNKEYSDFVQKRKEMTEIRDRLSSLEDSFNKIEFYLELLLKERLGNEKSDC